ncbi:serine/threonine-protein kinase [Chondromyces crocatus]|uniref:Protein kinase domain-containing protein n=1 Tax=Chondromyces crocatus TaxID=52 RepID=A0A0K1ENF4_CHOCO|nr:serine/threonine-protein kinase [Chondromyces crocatus]AKT42376.1 uncharacterized protein CMC5_066020 [Chondromyces crocatus]
MSITPGMIVGGKYRLGQPVSRGGMGSVWAAEHLQLGSAVALKFMDPSFASSPAFRTRFEREARVAASLKTPHVVHVSDYGIDAAGPFIAMELLHGEDLQTRLEQRKRLPIHEVSVLLGQLGKALRRAHEVGLIHRDLKPRNIFLARVDDEEVLKVLDFGIAKDTMGRSVAESTSTGELMGSPHYMSPEQLRADRDLDARSDLWSVGVILFRCLTGRLPFPGDVLGTVMARVLVDPVPQATQIAPDLPPGVDAFFARCMTRDREQRFQNIRELVDAFAQLAGGAPFGVTTAGVQMSPFASAGGSGAYPAQAPGVPPASGGSLGSGSYPSGPLSGAGSYPQGAAHGAQMPSSAPRPGSGAYPAVGAAQVGGPGFGASPPRGSFHSMPGMGAPGSAAPGMPLNLAAPIPVGTPVGTLASGGTIDVSTFSTLASEQARKRKAIFAIGGAAIGLVGVIAAVALSEGRSDGAPEAQAGEGAPVSTAAVAEPTVSPEAAAEKEARERAEAEKAAAEAEKDADERKLAEKVSDDNKKSGSKESGAAQKTAPTSTTAGGKSTPTTSSPANTTTATKTKPPPTSTPAPATTRPKWGF